MFLTPIGIDIEDSYRLGTRLLRHNRFRHTDEKF